MNNSRRSAIKKMTLFSMASGILWPGGFSTQSTAKVKTSPKPLNPFYLPSGQYTYPEDLKELYIRMMGGKGGSKIRAEHTNGQLCCQELFIPPKQAGPPPHLHHELDEVMRVLEGTIHLLVGETVIEVHEGDWHVRPHGVIHTFWNASEKDARFIDIYPNQNFLQYLEDMFRVYERLQLTNLAPETPEVQEYLVDLHKEYGIEIFYDKFPAIIEKYGLKV